MEWISVKDKLPEDIFVGWPKVDPTSGDDYIECLVHTNVGNRITNRYHSVDIIPFEYEPGVIGKKQVDNGWKWFIEISNCVRETPIIVDYWIIIPEFIKQKK